MLLQNIIKQYEAVTAVDLLSLAAIDRLTMALDEMVANGKTDLLLFVEGDGGSIYEGNSIYGTIQRYKENYNLNIVSLIGAIAASASYLITLSSDLIIAREDSKVGSIGIIGTSYTYPNEIFVPAENSDQKLGLLDKKNIPIIKEQLNKEEEAFINLVAKHRNIDPELIKSWNGGIFSGTEAFQKGLIDRVYKITEVPTFPFKKIENNTNNTKNYDSILNMPLSQLFKL